MIFRIISVTYFSPRKYRFESIKFPTVLSVGTILHVRRPPTSRRTQTLVVQEEKEREIVWEMFALSDLTWRPVTSVTRLGSFWNVLETYSLTKWAQILYHLYVLS